MICNRLVALSKEGVITVKAGWIVASVDGKTKEQEGATMLQCAFWKKKITLV